jgi:oligopeptide/dipeptide ABC transporter ATP-binding protein
MIDEHQTQTVLQVDGLKVSFVKEGGRLLPVIDSASFAMKRNEAIGIVGESGSGKTMLCRSLIGTLERRGARITAGRILFERRDLAQANESAWRQVRGREIGYVPQSSLSGLNPVLSIGTQLVEAITAVSSVGHGDAWREAVRLLEMVRIPRAEQVLGERAYHLSGGMRQRVMIAAALAQKPKLLIADEPTTALDVTVQHEILELIRRLRAELGMALILVSHDLAVIEEVCDSVVVMYAGATVEVGPVSAIEHATRHPYSRALRTSRVDTAIPGQDLDAIPGDPPSIGSWPTGCRFWPRCPLADDACRPGSQPGLQSIAGHLSACLHADRMAEEIRS